MTYARHFLANYSFLVVADLLGKGLRFWAFVHMAQIIGTNLLGDIIFATAFVAYFALFASQGLDLYGTRELARDTSRVGQIAGTILALRLVTSTLAASALVVTALLLKYSPSVRLLILLYGMTLFSSAGSLQWVFQGTEQMRYVAAANVILQGVVSGCILTLLHHPSQFFWVPIFQFLGELFGAAFLLYMYQKHWASLQLSFRVRAWWRTLHDSVPIGLSVAVNTVLANFDLLLLGFMATSEEVGWYGAASRMILLPQSFVGLYHTNLFPALSRTRDIPKRLRRLSDVSLQYMLLFGIPPAVGIMLLAQPIMELAFGSAFAGGAVALQILIWTLPVLMVRMCHGMVLVAHGYQNTHLWIRLLAAMTNVALNIVLISRYGYIGAASANLTAQVIMCFLCYQQVAKKVIHLPVFPSVWRPALASVCMAFFLHWMLESLLLVRIMAGLLVYIFCAWCIGAFTIKDLMELLGLWSTRVAVEGNAKLTFSQQTMSPRD